jgi:hypothetical protein
MLLYLDRHSSLPGNRECIIVERNITRYCTRTPTPVDVPTGQAIGLRPTDVWLATPGVVGLCINTPNPCVICTSRKTGW